MSEYLTEDSDEVVKKRKRKRTPTPESELKLPPQFQKPPVPITAWEFDIAGGDLYGIPLRLNR